MSTSTPSAGAWSTVRNGFRAVVTIPPFVAMHVWRSCRIDRSQRDVDELSEPPPAHEPHPQLQHRDDGVGPILQRTYQVAIVQPRLSAGELIEGLRIDPNYYISSLVAGFVNADVPARNLEAGDELVVELPGPWNGPVVVQHADDQSLLLATLNGHMEAGHIRFDTTPLDDSHEHEGFSFRIRSWARAGDPAFAAIHVVVPIAKELQTAMWTAMCQRAVLISGGHQLGNVEVITEELNGSWRRS